MALAGTAKIATKWLASVDSQILGDLNDEERIKAGKGKYGLNDKGQVVEEDMPAYLTGTKRIKVGTTGVIGEMVNGQVKPYAPGGKPTKEGLEMLNRINALQSKQKKAEAIAAQSKHPEQKKRANLLAERFKGQVTKLTEWLGRHGKKLQKPEPERPRMDFPKVEDLANAIAENARQLQEALRQEGNALIAPPEKNPSQGQTGRSEEEAIPDAIALQKQGYEIIGSGAYGRVYRKGDRAVKYGTGIGKRISESEYAIGKKVAELGIGPKVYGRNNTDSGEAMAMEFIEGETLVARYKGDFRRDRSLNGEAFDQTLQVMATLHREGIAHNDLHQANVIQGSKGVKVIDFGRATQNNPQDIFKELLKPPFLQWKIKGADGTIAESALNTPNSRYRAKYETARSEFLADYGEDDTKWPTGKKAQKAIADFYSFIFD